MGDEAQIFDPAQYLAELEAIEAAQDRAKAFLQAPAPYSQKFLHICRLVSLAGNPINSPYEGDHWTSLLEALEEAEVDPEENFGLSWEKIRQFSEVAKQCVRRYHRAIINCHEY